MPELPEVETVRRGLAPVMTGRRIVAAEIRRPDLRWPLPEGLGARLTGRRVERLGRRSKYLLIGLDGAETLIVHLGMSGRMLVSGAGLGRFHHRHPAPDRHDHVVLHVEGGARVVFNDARRFGAMDLCPNRDLRRHRFLAAVGPEPLDPRFTARQLAARLAGRQTPLKAALLDQRLVAGLGNIYAAEALWQARLSPLMAAARVDGAGAAALHRAIRAVLRAAIAAGGSSLRDHRQADGALGYFQHSFRVYGRAEAPCLRRGCDGTIVRVVQSGRSSFFCPVCQRG